MIKTKGNRVPGALGGTGLQHSLPLFLTHSAGNVFIPTVCHVPQTIHCGRRRNEGQSTVSGVSACLIHDEEYGTLVSPFPLLLLKMIG